MTYIYSRALAAAYLEACFADTALCAQWNSIRTVDLYLYNGKTTDSSLLSRYGMTFEHLTDEYGGALLTWYREASLARISVPPETEPVLPATNLRSGLKCSESFGRYDRSSSLWKTPANLFGEDSILSSKDWTKAGTMRNGVCWERTTWVRLISENDAGFLERVPTPRNNRSPDTSTRHMSLDGYIQRFPTPTAQDAKNRTNPSQYRRPSPSLAAFVHKYPIQTDTVKKPQRWRTPDIHGGGRSMKLTKGITHRESGHPIQIRLADQVGGKLNPDWTEWLMGFPVGWSALKDLATPKCRFVPPSLGQRYTSESISKETSHDGR